MTKQKTGSPENPDLRAAKRRSNRATHIRGKLERGKDCTDEELAFLAEYEGEEKAPPKIVRDEGGRIKKGGPGRPRKKTDVSANAAKGGGDGKAGRRIRAQSGAPAPGEGDRDAGPEPEESGAPPLEPTPGPGSAAGAAPLGDDLPFGGGPLPKPPRVKMADDDEAPRGKRASSGKWQDKYDAGVGDASGRESACLYVGALWHGALNQFATSLREAGIEPIVDPDKLRGAIVLTLDEVLPPEFELTPTIVATVGSSALLAQRAMNAKKIREARDAKEAKDKAAAWREEQRKRASEPAPEPVPAPAPAPFEPPVAAEVVTPAASKAIVKRVASPEFIRSLG